MIRDKLRLILILSSLFLIGLAVIVVYAATTAHPSVIDAGGGHLENENVALDYTVGQPIVGVYGKGLCVGFWCGTVESGSVGTLDYAIHLPMVQR